MKIVFLGGAALALAGLMAAAAPAGSAPLQTPAPAITLFAKLTAAAERPGPGDPKGSGSVVLHVEPAKDRVCYELSVQGVAVTMAHIHQATAEDTGPPLADLKPPGKDGKSSGCFEAGPVMLEGLTANPGAYYVNVHSAQHQGGALRGQLGSPSAP